MDELAGHILFLAKTNGVLVTNLALQKVMYYTLGTLVTEGGNDEILTELYSEQFVAGLQGPYIPSVYQRYKRYGRTPIVERGIYNDKLTALDRLIVCYLKRDVMDMIRDSRSRKTWRDAAETRAYTIDDLRNDFK